VVLLCWATLQPIGAGLLVVQLTLLVGQQRILVQQLLLQVPHHGLMLLLQLSGFLLCSGLVLAALLLQLAVVLFLLGQLLPLLHVDLPCIGQLLPHTIQLLLLLCEEGHRTLQVLRCNSYCFHQLLLQFLMLLLECMQLPLQRLLLGRCCLELCCSLGLLAVVLLQCVLEVLVEAFHHLTQHSM